MFSKHVFQNEYSEGEMMSFAYTDTDESETLSISTSDNRSDGKTITTNSGDLVIGKVPSVGGCCKFYVRKVVRMMTISK